MATVQAIKDEGEEEPEDDDEKTSSDEDESSEYRTVFLDMCMEVEMNLFEITAKMEREIALNRIACLQSSMMDSHMCIQLALFEKSFCTRRTCFEEKLGNLQKIVIKSSMDLQVARFERSFITSFTQQTSTSGVQLMKDLMEVQKKLKKMFLFQRRGVSPEPIQILILVQNFSLKFF